MILDGAVGDEAGVLDGAGEVAEETLEEPVPRTPICLPKMANSRSWTDAEATRSQKKKSINGLAALKIIFAVQFGNEM